MATETLRHPGIEPAHPGELLADVVIPATGKTKSEIARLLGISRQTLHAILNKSQSITPGTALRLGKLFGDGPGPWLRMQMAHDLWRAEQEIGEAVAKIPTLPVPALL